MKLAILFQIKPVENFHFVTFDQLFLKEVLLKQKL